MAHVDFINKIVEPGNKTNRKLRCKPLTEKYKKNTKNHDKKSGFVIRCELQQANIPYRLSILRFE